MREPYITQDGRIHHSWGNLASFGYAGYMSGQEHLSEIERCLLAIWCWDQNMMHVFIENPDYDPMADERFYNMPMMRGKSILPTEMRDFLSSILEDMGLINQYGVPTHMGPSAGMGTTIHAKELE